MTQTYFKQSSAQLSIPSGQCNTASSPIRFRRSNTKSDDGCLFDIVNIGSINDHSDYITDGDNSQYDDYAVSYKMLKFMLPTLYVPIGPPIVRAGELYVGDSSGNLESVVMGDELRVNPASKDMRYRSTRVQKNGTAPVHSINVRPKSITGNTIAEGAIDTIHLKDGSVNISKIAPNGIVAGKYTNPTFTVNTSGIITDIVGSVVPASEDTYVKKEYVDEMEVRKLSLGGGVMDGDITGLPDVPPTDTSVVSKKYVTDQTISKLPLTGGVMAGIIRGIPATPIEADEPASKAYVDSKTSGTDWVSSVDLDNTLLKKLDITGGTVTGDINGLPAVPPTDSSAVSKQYVTDAISSLTKPNLGSDTVTEGAIPRFDPSTNTVSFRDSLVLLSDTGAISGPKMTVDTTVAIGDRAGAGQEPLTVAVGAGAGADKQGEDAVAVGAGAGADKQGPKAIAIGYGAGSSQQGVQGLAIGYQSGAVNQGSSSVAIGFNAGMTDQSAYGIGIGSEAGGKNQGESAIALGFTSGNMAQGTKAVAIGGFAGYDTQGDSSVAIGYGAGYTNLPANSIVLNATGTNLSPTSKGFYVSPMNSNSTPGAGAEVMMTDPITKEVFSSSRGVIVSVSDPTDPTKTIIHTTPTAPEEAVFYRGTGVIPEGQISTTIAIPSYATNIASDFTVHISQYIKDGDSLTIMASTSLTADGKFDVFGTGSTDRHFHWIVYGKRIGSTFSDIVQTSPPDTESVETSTNTEETTAPATSQIIE